MDNDIRELAKKRVKQRRDFAAHCVAYIVVNAMLVAVWAITDAGYFWPAWVMLGWGVGLALNAWDVYFRRPITEEDIQNEMQRLRREPSDSPGS